MSNGQRGVIAPIWLYLAGAIAVMLALAGLIKVWDNYTTGLVKGGYDRGVAETTATYTARDNAQLQAVVAAQRQAEIRAAKAESDAATAQALASSNYAKGVEDGKAKTAARVAAVHTGNLRLRDPGSQARACPAVAATTAKAASAGPAGGSDAHPAAELSAAPAGFLSTAASDFLLGLTGEADDVARQLAAAQAIIVSDRKLCNGP